MRKGCLIILCLLLTACSDDYQAERRLWWVKRDAQAVLSSPEAATPEQIEEILTQLKRLANDMPNTQSGAQALLMVGSLYVLQENYPAARDTYQLIRTRYPNMKKLSMQSAAAMASLYERENNWPEAVNVYERIVKEFPQQTVGLEAYLYVAKKYADKGDEANAQSYYRKAAGLYETRLKSEVGPAQILQLKGYLGVVYQALGEWGKAANVMSQVADMQKGIERFSVLMALARVHAIKLNQKDQARVLYEKILNEFDDPKMQQMARASLAQLDKPSQSIHE